MTADATPETPIAMQLLTDRAGDLYLLPRPVAEAARVPAEDRQAVAAAFGGRDVEGYFYTTSGVNAYIAGLEARLAAAGDDAQLAQVDLRNLLQRQQQTLQLVSTLSKMLHDTALATIRRIGG